MDRDELAVRIRNLVFAAGIPDDERRWEFAEYASEILASWWGFDDAEGLARQAYYGEKSDG